MPELLADVYDWIEVLLPLAMVPVVARAHRPYVAIAWLAVILLLPVTGTLACLYLSEFRIRRGRRHHQELLEQLAPVGERLRDLLGEPAPEADERGLTGSPERDERGLMRLLERAGGPSLGGWPAVGGNEVVVVDESQRFLDALVHDIDHADRHVHLLFYLFAPDGSGQRVGEALARAARRGVDCRLMAGAYSSRYESHSGSLFRDLVPELRKAGVECAALRPMHPLRNGLARIDLRNHRKLAVIDGQVAWIGSQNIHDPDHGLEQGEWRQVMARIRGPGALQVQSVFAQDWCFETGECPDAREIFPRVPACGPVTTQTLWWGPNDPHPALPRALLALLGSARQCIHLSTPYFVPDEPVRLAFQVAAHRGVDVHVVLPMRSDKWYVDAAARAGLDSLVAAGVHVHRHQRGALHSKCLSVDDEIALVGSGNCDQRSFYLDYEIATVFYDAELAQRLRRVQEGYIAESETVDPEAWSARSRWRAASDSTLALFSPVL